MSHSIFHNTKNQTELIGLTDFNYGGFATIKKLA